jgi:hypothetical protein
MDSEHKVSHKSHTMASIVGIITFCLLLAMMLRAFVMEGRKRSFEIKAGVPEQAEDCVDIYGTIQSVDPLKGEVLVRLTFEPQGIFLSEDESCPREDLRVMTNSSTRGEFILKADKVVNAQDVTLSLFDGNVSSYPFDRHKCELQISLSRPGELDDKGFEKAVPVSMDLSGAVNGIFIAAVRDKECNDRNIALTMTLSRSSTCVAVAIFIMVMLWMMSLSVVYITISVFFKGRKIEFASFGWMATMLFAFFAFRNAAPGAPPIGSLIDFISFFWSEIIVASCLVATVFLYVNRPQT